MRYKIKMYKGKRFLEVNDPMGKPDDKILGINIEGLSKEQIEIEKEHLEKMITVDKLAGKKMQPFCDVVDMISNHRIVSKGRDFKGTFRYTMKPKADTFNIGNEIKCYFSISYNEWMNKKGIIGGTLISHTYIIDANKSIDEIEQEIVRCTTQAITQFTLWAMHSKKAHNGIYDRTGSKVHWISAQEWYTELVGDSKEVDHHPV